jgi:hypothetical protein
MERKATGGRIVVMLDMGGRVSLAVIAAATVAIAVAGCTRAEGREAAQAPTPPATVPERGATLADLRARPLRLPTLDPGDRCETDLARKVSPAFAPGLGDGPVYPVGFARRSRLVFEYPPARNSLFAGSEWGGSKVLWVSDPDYEGPILIRGHQLDGPNELRLQQAGRPMAPALAMRSGEADNWTGGWRNFPSYTRLRAPGCYAYQVDGDGFTDVITFEAVIGKQ